MTWSTKTRLLLRDKCKVVHSDRLYRPEWERERMRERRGRVERRSIQEGEESV